MRKRTVILTALLTLACLLPQATWAQAEEFWSGHFQTSDGVELHYLEAGSGPTLVFVPGWTMPAEVWEHQLRHFASTHRVVALDPRGQGRSEKPAHGYHPSRRALDIGELLGHLGGEPAVVAGWSLAMQEVLVLAHEFGTENIRAAVLVDHPIEFDPARFGLASRFASLQVEREEWTRKFIRAVHRSPQSDRHFEAMTQAALSTPTNAAAIMIANLILMEPTDLRPALDALNRPALFIYSSQEWAVEQAERVRRLARRAGGDSRRYWTCAPRGQTRGVQPSARSISGDVAGAISGRLGTLTLRRSRLTRRSPDEPLHPFHTDFRNLPNMSVAADKKRELPAGVTIRHEPRPGDIGYLLYLHGFLYAQEFGWDCTFEAGMAGSLATFATNLTERDRLWLVDDQERLTGSSAVDGKSANEAELRWVLLHPDLRGKGIGRLLVEEAIAFCRAREYKTVRLWTAKVLKAATRLYESIGFELAEEWTETRWSQPVTMRRYELKLR